MNYMRQIILTICYITVSLISIGCNAFPTPPIDGKIKIPSPTTKGSLPSGEASDKIVDLMADYFLGCEGDDKNTYFYTFQGGKLVELGNLAPIIEQNLFKVYSPAEERDGINWIGSLWLNANYTKLFDFTNLKEEPAKNGTTIPNPTINLQYQRGRFRCDTCASFKKPSSCGWVEKTLTAIEEKRIKMEKIADE